MITHVIGMIRRNGLEWIPDRFHSIQITRIHNRGIRIEWRRISNDRPDRKLKWEDRR